MSQAQVIEPGGKPVFYGVPASVWHKARGKEEGIEDEGLYDQAVANGFPAPVAYVIADEAHAVRAWREYRGMTQDALAAAAGLSKPFSVRLKAVSETVVQ
ncbi:MAG: helix-turn-helix domain-containing protein [Burkholderiaceae bacterium]|jgi:hypothetical protein|nr:helix-turn-helix domain-containing protein [Burkholderiaceae bacterium]